MPATAPTAFHIRVIVSMGAMFFTPSESPFTGHRDRAVQEELRRRDHARPELVLQPQDLDSVRSAVGVARFDVEEREAAPARRVSLRDVRA